jgi:hypothetical protein
MEIAVQSVAGYPDRRAVWQVRDRDMPCDVFNAVEV